MTVRWYEKGDKVVLIDKWKCDPKSLHNGDIGVVTSHAGSAGCFVKFPSYDSQIGMAYEQLRPYDNLFGTLKKEEIIL